MDVAYVSALSALAGSVIGGMTSGVTTWLNQRSQARAAQIAHDILRREDLIRDFIIAASKAYGDAIVNNDPRMPELVDLYAMLCRFLDAGGMNPLRALGRPASKKRQGTKSRDAGQRLGVERYGDFRLAAHRWRRDTGRRDLACLHAAAG